VPQAQAELELFQREPGHPRYQQAAAGAQQVRKLEAEAERQYRKRYVDARSIWDRPTPQRAIVTVALVLISVAVTIATHFGHSESALLQRLTYAPWEEDENGAPPTRTPLAPLETRQPWRLVTPIFLHFNLMHIFFNMMFLYDVGGRIEMYRGRWRFLLLVVVSAAVSNFAQSLVSGPFFGGMSGVDYALFGYAWMKTRYDPTPGLFLPPETILMGLIWLVVCMTNLVGNIANTAHFVGLGVGIIAGGAAPWMQWLRRKWRKR
jgi:rhomboid protease GlpG